MVKTELKTPTLRIMMLPDDINSGGAMFVGSILKYALIAAQVEACQSINRSVKLTSITNMSFSELPQVGEIVDFHTGVNVKDDSGLVVFVKFVLDGKLIGSTDISFTPLNTSNLIHYEAAKTAA